MKNTSLRICPDHTYHSCDTNRIRLRRSKYVSVHMKTGYESQILGNELLSYYKKSFVRMCVAGFVAVWLCPLAKNSRDCRLVRARAGHCTHRAKRGHCTWRDMPSEARCGFRNMRAGDKAERSEVWVTDNESRTKRGVGYAMLVSIILNNIFF